MLYVYTIWIVFDLPLEKEKKDESNISLYLYALQCIDKFGKYSRI